MWFDNRKSIKVKKTDTQIVEFNLLLLIIALYLWFIFIEIATKIFLMSNKYKNISVISTGSWVPSDQYFSMDTKGTYQVQVNELVLMVSIGIHEHEKVKKQRVSISLSIQVLDNLDNVNENINNVVSYERIIKKLKNIISKGHIELLETLGEKIMDMCFEESRIMSVWMKLEKLDVFSETKSVGIEIIRNKRDHSIRKSSKTNIEKITKK